LIGVDFNFCFGSPFALPVLSTNNALDYGLDDVVFSTRDDPSGIQIPVYSLFTDRYENSEPIFSNPEREAPNLLSSTQKDKLSGTVNYKPEGKEIFIHQSFDQSA